MCFNGSELNICPSETPWGLFSPFLCFQEAFTCKIPFLETSASGTRRVPHWKSPQVQRNSETAALLPEVEGARLWYSDVTGDSQSHSWWHRDASAGKAPPAPSRRARVTWRRWKDGCWDGGKQPPAEEASGISQHWSSRALTCCFSAIEAPAAAFICNIWLNAGRKQSGWIPQQMGITVAGIWGKTRAAVTSCEVHPGSEALTRLSS